jgi:hypothetical protein
MHLHIARLSVLALLVVTGCAFRQHGVFCGPGYPKMPEDWSADERKTSLERTPPIDDVDAACKAHDLCYLAEGFSEKKCDDALKVALATLDLRPSCDNVAGDISTWFIGFHPSVTKGDTSGAFALGFSKVVASPLIASMVVLHTALQLFGRAGRDEPCCDRTSFMQAADGPCFPHDASPIRLRVMRALAAGFSKERNLYYETFLPAGITQGAQRQTNSPSAEPVVAVLSGEVLGFSESLVFTESAMHFKSLGAPATTLPYAQIDNVELNWGGLGVVVNGTYKISVLGMQARTLAAVIQTVREAINAQ